MKHLGKKPPKCSEEEMEINRYSAWERMLFMQQALIEVADELDKSYDLDIADLRKLSKKLRISAGIEGQNNRKMEPWPESGRGNKRSGKAWACSHAELGNCLSMALRKRSRRLRRMNDIA